MIDNLDFMQIRVFRYVDVTDGTRRVLTECRCWDGRFGDRFAVGEETGVVVVDLIGTPRVSGTVLERIGVKVRPAGEKVRPPGEKVRPPLEEARLRYIEN